VTAIASAVIAAVVAAVVAAAAVGRIANPVLGPGLPTSNGSGGTTNVTVNESSMVIDVAAKATPAVVTILTQQVNFFSGTTQGIGSGFFVSSDGYIVTNRHVVAGAQQLQVVRPGDTKRYDARVIGTDPQTDIAVLKIDGSGFPTLHFGDSSGLKVGQEVVAIGSPLGERDTVTHGIVSALHRTIDVGDPADPSVQEELYDTIQTDASINPGNSGGPLLDSQANVVGVDVATSTGGTNIGFAVDANSAAGSANQLMRTGHVTRPYLGISYQNLDSESAAAAGKPEGALVQSVDAGSPADSAGLKPGDVIVKVDGAAIDDDHPLVVRLREHQPGEKVTLTVQRDGHNQDVQVTLGSKSS
jgi:S1-C subfamily serine protease